MKFAVIETGGKQYVVAPGDELRVERLVHDGAEVLFDKVLLTDNGSATMVGSPYIADARVTAAVVKDGRAKKVIVFKYKNKTRSRVKRGHRQQYTTVKIQEIK